MSTAYLSHPLFLQHEMGKHHPESPARLQAIERQLVTDGLYDRLRHYVAPAAERSAILGVHSNDYLQSLELASPTEGYRPLDPDTSLNPHSLQAALHAAGAGIRALELVMSGEVNNAFCAVRPPGHHAEPQRAMGFCLFNNIAITAHHALEVVGLERVAIIDFDVHHGNGTEAMLRGDPRVLFCSSFQHPFYPGTRLEEASDNTILVPLHAGDGSQAFQRAYSETIIPAVESFAPQLLLVSAGFDAHIEDAMSGLALHDEDYRWISVQLTSLAARCCEGRLISFLEGGYALDALGRCVSLHLQALVGAAG